MLSRGKVLAGITASLVLLSGCSLDSSIESIQKPVPSETATSLPSMSEEDYAAAIARIQADEELQAELLRRIEAGGEPSPEVVEEEKPSTASGTSAPVSSSAPVPSSTPTPTPTVSVAPTIAQLAYRDARTIVDGSTAGSMEYLELADSITADQTKVILDNLSISLSMWDEEVGIVTPYKAVYFTNTDLDWATQQVSKYGGSIPFGSFSAWTSKFDNGGYCGLAFSTPKAFYACLSTNTSESKTQIANNFTHEYYHSVQNKMGINHLNLPVWIVEGSASYMATIASNGGYTQTQNYAKAFGSSSMTTKFGPGGLAKQVFSMGDSGILEIYRALEVGATQASIAPMQEYIGYHMGALAVENLIGQHGYKKFSGFMKAVGSGSGWKSQFQKDFGQTPDDFYKDMLNYLKELYK